ncbi:hypothetical protein [Streptomyces sp. NPDC048516]|uniref:hypothetical protein n=1 Tax=Streptomyces sp. NPDC048516 TaxID=3365565 RepID=UPI00371310A5
MALRCAVLDDYQDIALSMAAWSSQAGAVDVRTLRRPLGSEDEVVAAIGDCGIVVAMRERTPFPASLLARLPAGHPPRTLPNVLALPHLGYVTRRNYEGYFRQAVEDITAFPAGSPVRELG